MRFSWPLEAFEVCSKTLCAEDPSLEIVVLVHHAIGCLTDRLKGQASGYCSWRYGRGCESSLPRL